MGEGKGDQRRSCSGQALIFTFIGVPQRNTLNFGGAVRGNGMYGTDSVECIAERIVRVGLESGKIRQAHSYARGRARCAAALCLSMLLASCVMPLAASKAPRRVALRLDAPQPFDPSADLTTLMSGVQSSATPVQDEIADFAPTMLVSGPAAKPFELHGTAQDKLRASLCLTAAIYYEAGNEPDEGQRAVAQVILNRVRHPAYPDTVCGVVYQGTDRNDTLCQFTFGCDGSMARMPVSQVWNRARRNAQAALLGQIYAPVGLATHYHTLAVNPVWNKALTPTAIVGAHIFFRWPGGAGNPKSFHMSYRGNEPIPAPKPKIVPAPALSPEIAELNFPGQDLLPNTYGRSTPSGLSAPRLAAMEPAAPISGDLRYVPGTLPESNIREEYRTSGQWKTR